MKFFFITLLLLPIGRKIGWWVSRNILYQVSNSSAAVLCLIWATTVSGGIYWLIDWANPGVLLRWIMGYFIGCYIAIPNYGLLDESSIPPHAQLQHTIISNLPVAVYIAASIAFYLLFPHAKALQA